MAKAKTIKKQASKLSKLGKLLSPDSPRKGLLLFVIAFGVIGGGYMVFKSHADTITNYYDSIQGYQDAKLTTDKASKDKYATKVWSIPKVNSSVVTSFTIKATNYEVDYTPCITIRRPLATASEATVEIAGSKRVNTGGVGTVTIPATADYGSYCSNGNFPFTAGESGTITVQVTNQTGGSLNLGSVYLGYK